MIRILLADTEQIDVNSVLGKAVLPSDVGGTEKNNKERVGAYALLSFAISAYTDMDLSDVSVSRDQYGKPRLTDLQGGTLPIHFSISHSAGIVAVAISDEGEIGIDLEPRVQEDRAERLSRRLAGSLPPQDFSCESIADLVTVFRLMEDGTPAEVGGVVSDVACQKHLPFTARWTVMEAVMKCDGRGFAAVSDIQGLYREHGVGTTAISIGGRVYYLSLATVKNK